MNPQKLTADHWHPVAVRYSQATRLAIQDAGPAMDRANARAVIGANLRQAGEALRDRTVGGGTNSWLDAASLWSGDTELEAITLRFSPTGAPRDYMIVACGCPTEPRAVLAYERTVFGLNLSALLGAPLPPLPDQLERNDLRLPNAFYVG